MKPVGIKLKFAFIGLLYTVLCGAPVIADDIEIYTGSISSTSAITSRANILFVLDTSGSMDSDVVSLPPYDPGTTYVGCFDATRLYTEINFYNKDVSGVTYTGPQMYCQSFGPSFGYDITTRDQFNESAFKCDNATTALTNTGFYTDRIAQYRTITIKKKGKTTTQTSWTSINGIDDNDLTDPVECRADEGVHGEVAGDSKPYATDSTSASGWQAGSSGAVNWGSTGSSETVYTGNYMNYLVSETTILGSRLSVMQDALTDVINSSAGVNIGLMRFDQNAEGGMVVTPVGEINSTKAAFFTELGYMKASGGTPLSESFYEAVSYMQGDSVDYGNNSYGQDSSGSTVLKPSTADSRTPSGGATYKSPIIAECQKNFIVILTDGAPTSDSLSTTRMSNIGVSSCVDNCLDEIAAEIGSTDQSSAVAGDQFISTFTIGLESDQALLKATAQASFNATGIGEYFVAEDAISLTSAFSSIVNQVLEVDTTFSSPAVSVNAFNRSTHLNDLYFTLFKPQNNPHWQGNFKKYKLDFYVDTADVDGDGNFTETLPFIADKLGTAAVSDTTGFFKNGAVSYWTSTASPDGAEVGAGGSATHLTNTRNVYTFADAYNDNNGVLTPPAAKSSLTVAANALDKANVLITDTLLDIVGKASYIPGIPYRESLLDWAGGLDIRDVNLNGDLTDARLQIGDPLHAEPALVQYGQLASDSDGDGQLDPDLVAYVATNDGYLHAVNTLDGTEYFSFVPKEMLSNLSIIFDDSGSSPKSYGLDGSVVAWVDDVDNNGTISGTDHVYLYFGMRRGGNKYYSLDVTDRNNPKLRWVIDGGNGDFAELGQTWSTPNVEKLKLNGATKTVLIFGGGYDENQDLASVRTPDNVGRGVFIVDADTGELLWRAGPSGSGADLILSNMDYSIPSRVKPLDVDGSGYIDRLYVGDMGGQLWRFDIEESDTSSDLSTLIKGGRIADFAVDSSTNDARRFYYPPDVALIVQAGRSPYLSILGATGYRAGPLDTDVHDRIYMIREDDIYNTPASYTTLTESDLFDTTDNIIGQGTSLEKQTAAASLTSSHGWFISLEELDGTFIGEKSLSEPLILGGVGILTTFIPENLSSLVDSCIPQAGTGAIYYLNVTDGTPAYNLAGTVGQRQDRKKYLKRGGIPPSPSVIVTEDGSAVAVGTELETGSDIFKIDKTYWYEVEQQ